MQEWRHSYIEDYTPFGGRTTTFLHVAQPRPPRAPRIKSSSTWLQIIGELSKIALFLGSHAPLRVALEHA